MVEIDKKDCKILYELDRNSRIPYSKLGDTLKISQEAARHRVQKLVEKEVIKKFCTVVDSAKLGFAYYKVFLKLHNVNEKNIQEIMRHLERDPSLAWLVRIDGTYDIGFAVKARSIHDILGLSNLVDNLVKEFDCFINKRVFCVNIAGEYLTRSYLINQDRNTRVNGFYSVHSPAVPADEINVKIIKALADNARQTAVEIAKTLPLSSDAVLERIKSLEKSKIITRYNIVLNHYNLDQIHYKVFIYLNQTSPERQLAFMNACKTKPHVVFVVKTLAEWDFEMDIEVKDIRQYRQVMMELTSEYGEIIKEYDALMVSKIHKYNLF